MMPRAGPRRPHVGQEGGDEHLQCSVDRVTTEPAVVAILEGGAVSVRTVVLYSSKKDHGNDAVDADAGADDDDNNNDDDSIDMIMISHRYPIQCGSIQYRPWTRSFIRVSRSSSPDDVQHVSR